MRSVLTTLGIVIGVASVIAMVTLGRGATAKITADIAEHGHQPAHRDARRRAARADERDGGAARQRRRQGHPARGERRRRTSRRARAAARWSSSGTRTGTPQVTGTTNEYFDDRGSHASRGAGASPTPSSQAARRPACILGATVRKELFGLQDPIGAAMRVGTRHLQRHRRARVQGPVDVRAGPGRLRRDAARRPSSAASRATPTSARSSSARRGPRHQPRPACRSRR